jgi:hypothetical protein
MLKGEDRMSKNTINRVAMIMLCCLAMGCATTDVKSTLSTGKLEGNTVGTGIIYSLPEAMLQADVTYSLYKKVNNNGVQVGKAWANIEQPVKVSVIRCADAHNMFRLNLDAISDPGRLESKFTVTLNELGNLTGVNAEISDKTIDTVKSYVSAGIALAKIVAAAGKSAEGSKIEKLSDVTVSYVLKPPSIESFSLSEDKRTLEASLSVHPKSLIADLAGTATDYELIPRVQFLFSLPAEAQEHTNALDQTSSVNGIVYRMPMFAVITIDAGLLDGTFRHAQSMCVNLPQYGAYGVMPLKTKRLTDRTVKMAFGETSGTPTEYTVNSASSSDKVAAAVAESLGQVVQAQQDIIQHQVDVLKKQKDLQDAEGALKPPSTIEQLTTELETQSNALKKLKDLKDLIDSLLKPNKK